MFPKQKISESDKVKEKHEWARQCMEYIIDNVYNVQHVSDVKRMQQNYDLITGIIEDNEYSYVTHSLGQSEKIQYPAKLQNFNIIKPVVEAIRGQYIGFLNRSFGFDVVATNEEAISQKQSIIDTYTVEKAIESTLKWLETNGFADQYIKTISNEDYQEFVENGQKLSIEIQAKELLNSIVHDINHGLINKLITGVTDLVAVDRQIYKVEGDDNFLRFRVINPLYVSFILNSTSMFLHDAYAACELRNMTLNEINDEYVATGFLDEKDFENITSNSNDYNNGSIGDVPTNGRGIAYVSHPTLDQEVKTSKIDVNSDFLGGSCIIETNKDTYYAQEYVEVYEVEWRSFVEAFFVTRDNDGIEIEELEFTKPKKNDYVKIRKSWVSCIWEGVKIGDYAYCKMRRRKQEYRRIDDLSYTELSYTGIISTKRNSIATSIVDLGKPYQHTINMLWMKLQHEIAGAKGKILLMDISKLPKGSGIELEDFLYFLQAHKIALIDSTEMNEKGMQSNFNQFTQIDLSISQTVQQYLEIINYLKNEYEMITGTPRQKLGEIGQYETKGGAELSISQSSAISEYLFFMQNQVTNHLLRKILHQAKYSYKKGKKIQYVLPNSLLKQFTLQSDELSYSDIGINVVDSSYTAKQLKKLEELAISSLQAGKIGMAEMASIVMDKNANEIKSYLVKGEKRREEMEQKQQEAEMKQKQAEAEAEQKTKMMIENNKLTMNREDNETKLKIARLELEFQIKLGDMRINQEQAKQQAKVKTKDDSSDASLAAELRGDTEE